MPDTILFLGTGAADWTLDSAETPLRRFSSALINGELLIDPGPHLAHFAQSFGCQNLYADVTDVLLTHSHDDHFSLDTLSRLAENGSVTLYADAAVASLVESDERCARALAEGRLRFRAVPLWEPVRAGGYEVTALAANHATGLTGEAPRHLCIRTPGGKSIYYGCDGAWLLNRTWKALRAHCFDLMVMDGTIGDGVHGDERIFEHSSLEMVRAMCAAFRRTGVVREGGTLCVSHLARTLHGPHTEVEAALAPDGIKVAYDGLTLEF